MGQLPFGFLPDRIRQQAALTKQRSCFKHRKARCLTYGLTGMTSDKNKEPR
jgi:uncharacterized protein YukJ